MTGVPPDDIVKVGKDNITPKGWVTSGLPGVQREDDRKG
jgi:hypothetical protein